MKRLAAVFCMLLGCAVMGVYLFTTPGCACESLFPNRIYNLYALNTARDREPERVAERFLRDQSNGQCRPMESKLCEKTLALSDWRLEAREDNWSGAVLYYYVHLKGDRPDDPWAEAAVWVDLDGDHWQVTDFSVP
jgi:hypothetical protein